MLGAFHEKARDQVMERVRREPSESITMDHDKPSTWCEGLEGGEWSYTFSATQKVCGVAMRLYEAWSAQPVACSLGHLRLCLKFF